MSKICYACGKEVPKAHERLYYMLNKEKDTGRSWAVASKYALEWTFWKQPSDMEKYVQVPDSVKFCEVVCIHCINSALEGEGLPKITDMSVLTPAQKVRIARRKIDDMMRSEDECHDDVRAFHAPGECHNDVYRSFSKALYSMFDSLQLSPEEFQELMGPIIKKEAEFCKDEWDMPLAAYQAMYVGNH